MSEKPKNKGLIHACLLDRKGSGIFYTDNSWQNWTAGDGIIWVHYDYTVVEAQNWLINESGILSPLVMALIEPGSRPRVSSIGNNLL